MALPIIGTQLLGAATTTPNRTVGTDGTTGGTANGDSFTYIQEAPENNYIKHQTTHLLNGTLGGGTVIAYGSNDGVHWVTGASGAWALSLTGPLVLDVKMPYWKHTIAGATSPVLNSYII